MFGHLYKFSQQSHKSAPTLQRFHSPEADKSAVGAMMHIDKLIWTCGWVSGGRRIETRSASFAEAVGTINRPLHMAHVFC